MKVADKAIDRLQANIRQLSRRTRGYSLRQIIAELKKTLLGWKAYFDLSEVLSPLRDLDKWLRRRLRCYQWKQWGRSGYRLCASWAFPGYWPGTRPNRRMGHGESVTALHCTRPCRSVTLGTWGCRNWRHDEPHKGTAVVRDPYARWCGRRAAVRPLPIPISRKKTNGTHCANLGA